MSQFKKYKFASRTIRTRCNQDKVTVSKDDFEELVHVANVSCVQAWQLQAIIENLQKIKAEAVRKVLDKIIAEIEQNAYPIVHGVNDHELGMTLYGILQVIDKYRESEDKK